MANAVGKDGICMSQCALVVVLILVIIMMLYYVSVYRRDMSSCPTEGICGGMDQLCICNGNETLRRSPGDLSRVLMGGNEGMKVEIPGVQAVKSLVSGVTSRWM
jgi:hypothetical protein